ncbi:hypothetical protein EJB05_55761, partial [Eragrostis curvula]
MGRHPGSSGGGVQQKLRKGLWSPEEDEKLYNHIIRYGVGCWSSVPKLAGMHAFTSMRSSYAFALKQQVFDPFPLTDSFGGSFDAPAEALYCHLGGGKSDAVTTGGGFVDYSSVLDVSENLGYGESSSNSSNWTCAAPEVNNNGEPLNWGSESKVDGYGEAMEHKFLLPCHGQQEQSMPHFDFDISRGAVIGEFNLEFF